MPILDCSSEALLTRSGVRHAQNALAIISSGRFSVPSELIPLSRIHSTTCVLSLHFRIRDWTQKDYKEVILNLTQIGIVRIHCIREPEAGSAQIRAVSRR